MITVHERPGVQFAGGEGAPPVLEVRDLSVTLGIKRGELRAVNRVSFDLHRGEVLAIIGESGSGKTTVAEALLRLPPSNATATVGGSIRIAGVDVATLSERGLERLRGEQIGIIFQDSGAALNPALTIGFQLSQVFRKKLGLDRAAARARSIEVLRSVGLPRPEDRMKDYPHQLSGGMRQRAMIGIAIALEPAVLIADEATTALDVTLQAEILRLLREISERTGMAIVLISHDLALANDVADRVAVMYAGSLVEIGDTGAVLSKPSHPYTQALLASAPSIEERRTDVVPIPGNPPDPMNLPTGCPFSDRCSHAFARCAEQPALVRLPDGRSKACHLPDEVLPALVIQPRAVVSPEAAAEGASNREAILTVSGLRREYVKGSGRSGERIVAVDGVDLELRPSETLALVGESGSGKSTVAQIVAGLLDPTAGTVRFRGEEIWTGSRRDVRRTRRHIQMVFQDPWSSLDPRVTVGDAIREPWIVNKLGLSRKEQDARLYRLLDDVGLQHKHADRRPEALSGGQRQRVAIARALALNPAILVCDEPVSALDVSVQAQILTLLEDLQAEHGIAYLFISHDLAVVRQLAHRIAVMQRGHLVEVGDVEDVFHAPQHEYTQRLLASIPGRGELGLASRPGMHPTTQKGTP